MAGTPHTVDTWRASHPSWAASAGDGWLRRFRESALEGFAGFPRGRDERWLHTSLRKLVEVPFVHVDGDVDVAALVAPLRIEGVLAELVFVNGHFRQDLSILPEDDPCLLARLNSTDEEHVAFLRANLGTISRREEAFHQLNGAFLQDGAVLRVPEGTALVAPVHLISLAIGAEAPVVAHPRHLVVLEANASATVVETFAEGGDQPVLTNSLTEVRVGEGAHLLHAVTGGHGAAGHRVVNLAAEIGRNGRYHHHAAWLGGPLMRANLDVALVGEGAEATLDGLYVEGERDHVDTHSVLEHRVPHGRSRQTYKSVLGGRAKGVFDGLIVVAKDAQKTDAGMSNKNLLLSADANVSAMPRLEIYADDVKCAHGTTVGQLDQEQLGYLRSRGIPREQAVQVLTGAFVHDVVQRLPHEGLRERLRLAVEARLTEIREE